MKKLYYNMVVAAIGGLFLIFNAQLALAQDVKIVCSGGEAGPFPYPIGYVATGVTYKERRMWGTNNISTSQRAIVSMI